MTALTSYSGVYIGLNRVLREVDALRRCAEPFLTRGSQTVISNWTSALESFRDTQGANTTRWEIGVRSPIQTVDSVDYERGATRKLFATVSCVWELKKSLTTRRTNTRSTDRVCSVNGLAATQITFWESAEPEPLRMAVWTCEVGDGHQGTHFHTQVKAGPNPPFPKWLSVPRLPTYVVTPMDAIDFALSELFQGKWDKRLASQAADAGVFDSEQRKRLAGIVKWHSDCVGRTGGTAWTRIKAARPHPEILGTTL